MGKRVSERERGNSHLSVDWAGSCKTESQPEYETQGGDS